MKKVVLYTLLFFISIVAPNFMNACCRSGAVQKQNDVERIRRAGCLTYKYTNPENGITTHVSSRAGVYSGYYYKWSLVPCNCGKLTQEHAGITFKLFDATFHNNPNRALFFN